MLRFWIGFAGVAGLSVPAHAAWDLNMPKGATTLSDNIYDLHMLILGICVLVAIGVFGAMIYSIIAFRKSKHPEPATFSHSTKAEVIWTAIPFLILVGMAVPSAESVMKIEDASNPDLSIKITGYQWKWQYEYLDHDISFFSNIAEDSYRAARRDAELSAFDVENYLRDVDKPLVVPVGKKVRLLLTANDVIHSWWVPELYVKKDAVPGFINESWFQIETPGIYRGQCTELCGRGHGFMPIVVEAKTEDEYVAWLEQQGAGNASQMLASASNTPSATVTPAVIQTEPQPADDNAEATGAGPDEVDWNLDELMTRGESLYNTHCGLACHQLDGKGIPPAFPAIAGSAVATGDLAAHIDIALNGKAGTAMVGFKSVLTDIELASIVTYQRNAWGNDTGDLVTPAEIEAAR